MFHFCCRASDLHSTVSTVASMHRALCHICLLCCLVDAVLQCSNAPTSPPTGGDSTTLVCGSSAVSLFSLNLGGCRVRCLPTHTFVANPTLATAINTYNTARLSIPLLIRPPAATAPSGPVWLCAGLTIPIINQNIAARSWIGGCGECHNQRAVYHTRPLQLSSVVADTTK